MANKLLLTCNLVGLEYVDSTSRVYLGKSYNVIPDELRFRIFNDLKQVNSSDNLDRVRFLFQNEYLINEDYLNELEILNYYSNTLYSLDSIKELKIYLSQLKYNIRGTKIMNLSEEEIRIRNKHYNNGTLKEYLELIKCEYTPGNINNEEVCALNETNLFDGKKTTLNDSTSNTHIHNIDEIVTAASCLSNSDFQELVSRVMRIHGDRSFVTKYLVSFQIIESTTGKVAKVDDCVIGFNGIISDEKDIEILRDSLSKKFRYGGYYKITNIVRLPII